MTPQLAAERPTIKILLYSDDPRSITNGTKLLGLSSMIERLQAHAPAFAELSIKWVSRSSSDAVRPDNKLNVVLEREAETGAPFDAIWFFGLHQTNLATLPLGIVRGGPENELETEEIEALTRWMKINDDGTGGIGVLMTGDHNSPAPPNRLPGRNEPVDVSEGTLLGLGRALGQGVPRAGALRQWIGPPSASRADSFNTIASTGFQTDPFAQTLTLEKLNGAGVADSNGNVHPLFFYRGTEVIDKFPDHAHEGALVIPDLSNTDIWPSGQTGQPRPVFVAYGNDTVHGKPISLITAYDGDSAGVGRIVADSSWHHYLNINLRGFPHPAPVPSASDQIGQFYGNLAVWLAPLHKRRQMAQAMAWELADYTKLLERAGSETELGEIADEVLNRAAAPCEAHELLKALAPDQLSSESFSTARTAERWASSRKHGLGSVLWEYHNAMDQMYETATRLSAINPSAVISQGFANTVAARANGTSSARSTTHPDLRSDERRSGMACTDGQREWTIDMKDDDQPETLLATLVFCLNNENGIVNGKVSDGQTGDFVSSVTGRHKVAFNTETVGFMDVEFNWKGSNVAMVGATFKDVETTFFDGRFRKLSLASSGNGDRRPGEISADTLGSGDTGTSTGQTT